MAMIRAMARIRARAMDRAMQCLSHGMCVLFVHM